MKTLKLTSEQLRYKFKHIDSILNDRNVCNDDELFTLYSKFYDVILETNYNRKSNKKEGFVSKSTQLISKC